jgi:hypothetical protein
MLFLLHLNILTYDSLDSEVRWTSCQGKCSLQDIANS